jgi:hypothetical protein
LIASVLPVIPMARDGFGPLGLSKYVTQPNISKSLLTAFMYNKIYQILSYGKKLKTVSESRNN